MSFHVTTQCCAYFLKKIETSAKDLCFDMYQLVSQVSHCCLLWSFQLLSWNTKLIIWWKHFSIFWSHSVYNHRCGICNVSTWVNAIVAMQLWQFNTNAVQNLIHPLQSQWRLGGTILPLFYPLPRNNNICQSLHWKGSPFHILWQQHQCNNQNPTPPPSMRKTATYQSFQKIQNLDTNTLYPIRWPGGKNIVNLRRRLDQLLHWTY